MSAEVFFIDTNIFVYSFDDTSPEKQTISREIIETALTDGAGIISFQVIQEFINFSLKSHKSTLSLSEVQRYLNKVLTPLCQINSSTSLYNRAILIKEMTNFSWYDSIIVASALETGCNILYSEDLQHQRKIQGLTIIDPFQ